MYLNVCKTVATPKCWMNYKGVHKTFLNVHTSTFICIHLSTCPNQGLLRPVHRKRNLIECNLSPVNAEFKYLLKVSRALQINLISDDWIGTFKNRQSLMSNSTIRCLEKCRSLYVLVFRWQIIFLSNYTVSLKTLSSFSSIAVRSWGTFEHSKWLMSTNAMNLRLCKVTETAFPFVLIQFCDSLLQMHA